MEFRLNQYQGNDHLICRIESQSDTLKLTYLIHDQDDLVWPSYSGMVRENKLWLSTCFELFLGVDNQNEYTELNVTPAGAWNCYQFDDYRSGMRTAESWKLQNLEPSKRFFSATFSGQLTSSQVKLGPAVILRRKSSRLDYFAISHAAQPDFHDPARHVLVSADDL